MPATQNRVTAEGTPQVVHRLIQCRARTFVVQLGPEQGEDGVAPMKATRRGAGEPGEERQPLGLDQHGLKRAAVRIVQLDATQDA